MQRGHAVPRLFETCRDIGLALARVLLQERGFCFFGVPVKGQYKGSFKGSLTGYKGSSPGTRMFGFLGWDLGLWVCGLGFRYSLQTGVLGLWIRY